MSSKLLVSAIIIFFNEKKFITEAIESVIAQTYHDWELLLVDDGSSDESSRIALRHAKQNPGKVRYLEHEGHQNRGMSASRNLGIRNAKAQYIAFLDADDAWLPCKLEQQISLMKSQADAGMICGPTQWWYSWSSASEDGRRDFVHLPGGSPNTLIKPPTLLIQFLKNNGLSPCTCSILVRREVLERVGGFEENFHGLYEDQAFCAKVCLDTPVFASSECWCRYRQHADSASALAQRAGQHRRARLFFLNWLASYLLEHGMNNGEVWRTLEEERWQCQHPLLYRMLSRTQQLLRGINGRARAVVSKDDRG